MLKWILFPSSKIVELEEELRVVGNNLKSLEVSEEKVWLNSTFDLFLILSSKIFHHSSLLLHQNKLIMIHDLPSKTKSSHTDLNSYCVVGKFNFF